MNTFKSIALRVTAAVLSLALVGGSMSLLPAENSSSVTPIVTEANAATHTTTYCTLSNLRMYTRSSGSYRFSVKAKPVNVPSGVTVKYYRYLAYWYFYDKNGYAIGQTACGWTSSSLSGGTTMISPNVYSTLKGKGTVKVRVVVCCIAYGTNGSRYGTTDRSWSDWKSGKFYSL